MMATLRERLATLDTDSALRLVSEVRSDLFSKVAELRAAQLKVGGALCDRTRDGYSDDARRVAAAGGNPLALAGTAASFRKLRAACLWKARQDLRECLSTADRLRKRSGTGDIEALCIYDEKLPGIEARINFLSSLQFDQDQAARREKQHRQRPKLGRLPANWIDSVHKKTRGGIYGESVAVGILIPVRPEEISNRIHITLSETGALQFEVDGSKVSATGSGLARHIEGIGQPHRTITLSAVDPVRQETFNWLRERVIANGGQLRVGKGLTASGIGSAFRSMSQKLFARHKSPPSFYALRHAACAELKAAGMTAAEIAQAMGHSSELSQRAYGTSAQGSGLYKLTATASNPVRSPSHKSIPPSAVRKLPPLKRENRNRPAMRR